MAIIPTDPRPTCASLPPLPWGEAKAVDAYDVCQWLGLEPAQRWGRVVEGGRKFTCPWCGSRDAMRAYPNGRVHCFSTKCGKNASNIDLVRKVRHIDAIDAVKAIAKRFLIGLRIRQD